MPHSPAPHVSVFRTLHSRSEDQTAEIASWLAGQLHAGDRILLSGDLGAGKSVFARALIRSLADDPDMDVPSPTFTLVQEYSDVSDRPLWHSDLYRLEDEDEVYELGFDDIADRGIMIIEWPDRLPAAEQQNALWVMITTGDGDTRRLDFAADADCVQQWSDRLMPRALLLAAGMGSRMQDMSADRPKPLVKVAGQTLLDYALGHVRVSRQVGAALVNIHYRADQMMAHLVQAVRSGFVGISDEQSLLLETGGAVVKALPMLAPGACLVVNTDVILVASGTSVPIYDTLLDRFDPEIMDCLLLVKETADVSGFGPSGDLVPVDGVDGDRDHAQGDVHKDISGDMQRDIPVDMLGRVALRGDAPYGPYVYCGTMVTHSDVYADRPCRPFSNRDIFRAAMASGRLYALRFDGTVLHVGTPESHAAAEAWFARRAADTIQDG